MFQEWIRNKTTETVIGHYLQCGKDSRIKPEGKPHLQAFINALKNNPLVPLSNNIEILNGFDTKSNIHGLENLELVKEKPFIIAANHPNEGPLRGQGQRFVMNHYTYKITGKEIRWLHGQDRSSPQNLIRDILAKKTNSIPVKNKNPQETFRLLIQAITNKDIMGLNPEGDGSKSGLRRGLPEAGKLIALSASRLYSVLCVSTIFQNNEFILNISKPINKETIIKLIQNPHVENKQIKHQIISDYVMAIIAQGLPQEKRGDYSDFNTFIQRFNTLLD